MYGDDGAFLLHPVTQQNLRELSRTLLRECELRLCEWTDAARFAAEFVRRWTDEGLDPLEALDALGTALAEQWQSTEGDAPPSRYLTTVERAAFCRELHESLLALGIRLTESTFLPTEYAAPVVAYVRNPFADEAYDVFSAEMPDLTLRYVSSFEEGVRLLEGGEVGYCLLPLEESGGLRLSTVERLLHRYELHIARVTPVFGPDGTADLRYALVCRSASATPYSEEDDRYLELRTDGTGGVLGELSVLADAFSLSLYRVQTVAFSDAPYLSVVLSGQGADYCCVLLYLHLFCSATVVGLYRNLEG